MKRSQFLVIGIAVLALVTVAATANAQGTLFVKNNRVGIGEDDPQVPLHLDGVGDVFAGMGATPQTPGGVGFNYGYSPAAGGGFFNTRSGGASDLLFGAGDLTRILIKGASGNISFGTNVFGQLPASPLVHANTGANLSVGGVWTNASSRDLKQDIVELSSDDAMSALSELNPVTYRYIAEPDEPYVGFIAEDVPELVATGSRKTLAAMDVVAVLTKVVKEQQSTIDELSKRLAQLESQ